jgi:protoporphyrin/coproporphyrin ferrochelatase
MPRRLGVALFQLGGPDTLDAIEPFLYNLFSDPDIIDFPFARLGRKPLAKLISTTRARKVEHHYSVIGGGSPIRRFTEQQAALLETELRVYGINVRCAVAMRYWHPFTGEAIAKLESAGCDEFILLPLYPQYSSTTTGSSLNEWRRQFEDRVAQHRGPQHARGSRDGVEVPSAVHTVQDFYRHPLYLDAFVEKIDATLARFPSPGDAELVFSAHSVPISVIENGDPYQQQIKETVELLMERGGWPNRYRLCYQSKVGASKWLQPSLRATVRELGATGIRDVCVVPVSFVSDHVETLGEIDHEARELAYSAGIQRFEMVPGLNGSPKFIACLADLVMTAAGLKREEPALMAAD